MFFPQSIFFKVWSLQTKIWLGRYGNLLEILLQPFLKGSKSCFIFHKILLHLSQNLVPSFSDFTGRLQRTYVCYTPHVTNLSNVLSFSEKNKAFKKKNKTFSWKEQELFKIWPVVFSITASTCRTALFFLQIFQPLRKHPACRHSGWRIYLTKCFSRKISFRKTIPQKSERHQSGWNIPIPGWRIPEPKLSAGMPTDRAFASRLKLLKDFSRHFL